MKGINHTMKPAICRHRYACIACCIRNTVPYNHQNYCYPLSNMNPRYALSVWLAGWLAGWLAKAYSTSLPSRKLFIL